MDQEWGGWPEGDDPSGDAADTADLSGPDEPLGGYGGYDDGGGYDEASDEPDDGPAAGSDDGGGYLEDQPMSVLGDDGDPAGDEAYPADEPDVAAADSPETVVGADPDVDPDADWSPAEFPEQLDLTPPAPVDGYPWSDPAAVAEPGTGDDPTTVPQEAPPAQELLDYAATEGSGDPWAALLGSDDPAASSLGRWWSPA